MKRFYFHLCTPEGREIDDLGIEYDDVERAYLAACRAIPAMAAAILKRRNNPMDCSIEIESANGEVLMDIPFTEVVKARPASRPAAQTKPGVGWP